MQVRSKIIGGLLMGALAAALNVAGGGAAHAAQAAQVTGTPVTPFAGVFNPIKNVGNGMCLQPASTADTAAIVQEPCIPGSLAQGWQDRQIGTNHYNFINQLTGECIDAFDGAFNGARVLQTMCSGNTGNSNQQYNTAATLPNVVILMSRVGFRDTGFCIDVPGAQAIPGLAMELFGCNGTLAQRWTVGFP
jgi:Ricin-type beta-trefoil lectin domain-like